MVTNLELEIVLIIAGIVALAFWKKHPYLYLMAGLTCIFFGLAIYDSISTPLGIALAAIIGGGMTAFCFYKVVMKLLGKEE